MRGSAISSSSKRRQAEVFSTLKNLLSLSQPESVPARGDSSGISQDSRTWNSGTAAAGLSPEEIDAAFCGFLLGVRSPIDSDLNPFEKKMLRELDQLVTSNISDCRLLPALPAMIPEIMSGPRDQSSSSTDLLSSLGRDARIVSEIIQLANSPYFRDAQAITSLQSAVSVLGRVGVRQLAINAAFKPLINLHSGHFTKLSGTMLWQQSEKAAIACDCMARKEKTDRFKAYLMAIVSNVGFTVALKLLDRNFEGSLVPRSKLFHKQFIRRSTELSWLIAREWTLPGVVLEALESQIDARPQQALGSILYAGDKLSKLQLLATCGRFNGDMHQLNPRLQEHLTDSRRACYIALSY